MIEIDPAAILVLSGEASPFDEFNQWMSHTGQPVQSITVQQWIQEVPLLDCMGTHHNRFSKSMAAPLACLHHRLNLPYWVEQLYPSDDVAYVLQAWQAYFCYRLSTWNRVYNPIRPMMLSQSWFSWPRIWQVAARCGLKIPTLTWTQEDPSDRMDLGWPVDQVVCCDNWRLSDPQQACFWIQPIERLQRALVVAESAWACSMVPYDPAQVPCVPGSVFQWVKALGCCLAEVEFAITGCDEYTVLAIYPFPKWVNYQSDFDSIFPALLDLLRSSRFLDHTYL